MDFFPGCLELMSFIVYWVEEFYKNVFFFVNE